MDQLLASVTALEGNLVCCTESSPTCQPKLHLRLAQTVTLPSNTQKHQVLASSGTTADVSKTKLLTTPLLEPNVLLAPSTGVHQLA